MPHCDEGGNVPEPLQIWEPFEFVKGPGPLLPLTCSLVAEISRKEEAELHVQLAEVEAGVAAIQFVQ